MMKKKYMGYMKRTAAVVMCFAMTAGLAACSDTEGRSVAADEKAMAANDEGEITDVISKSLGLGSETDADKEETVYVISDSTGAVKETIVSEWLKNPEGKDEIKDISALTDIENEKGDESFEQDGKKLTWKAGGNDIYYQGKTQETPPVSVKATYYLDGKETSPSEIAGKSGHVKIRYEYTNDAKEDGVYTPFVMATGLILDLENFSNVEGKNAKVISDGSRYIVVGFGMPGMTESLKLDKQDIELPDYFEVEADAASFEVGMSITVASVETLGGDEDIDLKDVEKEVNDLTGEYKNGIGKLTDGIKEYTGGVEKVSDGAGKLATGADTLYKGVGTLSGGVKDAANGADSLAEGAGQVNDGAKKLSEGTGSAYEGAKQVSDGAAQLNNAVQAVELPDVSQMSQGEVDDETKASIKTTAESYLGGTDTAQYVGSVMSGAITNAVTSSVTSDTVPQVVNYKTSGESAVQTAAQSAAQGQATAAQTAAQTEAQTAAANYAGEAQATAVAIAQSIYGDTFDPNDPAQQAVIGQMTQAIAGAYGTGYGTGYGTAYCTGYGAGYAAEYIEYLTEFNSFSDQLSKQFGGQQFNSEVSGAVTNVANAYATAGSQVTLNKVGDEINGFSEKLDSLKAGTKKLADGSSSLTTGLATLNNGAATLANGTDTLSTGAKQLDDGMIKLKNGTDTLYSGAGELKDGARTLKNGTDTLVQNNSALNGGAKELGDATDKIVDKLYETEDGVNDFVDNVNKVKSAGRNYQCFGGISGDMTGKTKFIIKVDAVEAETNP